MTDDQAIDAAIKRHRLNPRHRNDVQRLVNHLRVEIVNAASPAWTIPHFIRMCRVAGDAFSKTLPTIIKETTK